MPAAVVSLTAGADLLPLVRLLQLASPALPVGAYTYGTNVPATVTMTTVEFGASYAGGQLTFTPVADGAYTFNFTATNANGGSAQAALTVNATLAAPVLSAATGVGNDRFTMNWGAVPGAGSYLVDVATADTFSTGGSGATGVIVETPNTGLDTGWEYVNGAATASSGANAYHKLVAAGGPGVVTPAFSTVGYLEAAAGFSVATFGGAAANKLTVSYSLNGGSSWTPIGTNSSATSSTYVTNQSMALPAGALGQASVRVKWHCDVATTNVGLRTRSLVVNGAQAAGGSTLVVSGQSVVGTSYEVTGLDVNTPYYYRVKAVGNTTGPLSSTGTATTTAEDAAPAFETISGQSAAVGVLFTLDVADYVTGYPVPAITLVSSTASGSDYSLSGGVLSYTPSAAGTYSFVFRASNTLGVASATASVAVASGPVYVPVASIANLASNSFTVNWTACTGATNYQVQVATDTNFTSGGGSITELFISEYIEGSSNNKAIEIFNGTGAPVDLAAGGYVLRRYDNGSSSIGATIGLTGTVASMDVFVVANPSANATILAQADATSGSMTHNGNDAIALARNGTNIDVVGTIGSSDVFGENVTKVRTNTVLRGNTTYTAAEWVNYASDTTSYLGSHTAGFGRKAGSILVDQTVAGLTYGVTGLTPSTPYWVRVRMAGGDWSGVVSATTTAGGEAPAPEPITDWVSPKPGGEGMGMRIQTVNGITYALQYTTNLWAYPPAWVTVDSEVGNGGTADLEDADCDGIKRFYRVVKP